MKYRPEIDGLRAVAVLPVLFYHAGVTGFTGGFVGVDVFFVISGYLITGLIWAEINENRFSIVKFYERRARRILPALFAVSAFAAIASYQLLPNGELLDFSNSLFATATFSSNLYFWSELDYFAAPAEAKPLLHMWSLAVEEQFYILFPLFLLAARRYAQSRVNSLMTGVLVASLVLSIWLVSSRPTDAFYLIHARAWELLLGAVLATGAVPLLSSFTTLRNALSAIGIALIGASVYLYDAGTAFPGLAAIPPCLGTFLFIWSNTDSMTPVGRVLTVKPMVAIGLISYSLYLWHWPLIVLAKYYAAGPLDNWEVAAILAASVLMAAGSWRFVEGPFRGRTSNFSQRQVFQGALIGALVLCLIGGMGNATRGFSSRAFMAGLDDSRHSDSARCFDYDGVERLADSRLCELGGDDSAVDFILWGDSHADAIFPVFKSVAESTGKHGVFAGEPACPPLLGVTRPTQSTVGGLPYDCREFNDRVFDYLIEQDIQNVFLVARWNLALGRPQFELENGDGDVFVGDDQSMEVSSAENFATYERGLDRTLRALVGSVRNVWLVLQVPNPGVRVPQYLAARARGGEIGDVRLTLEDGMARHERMRETFTEIALEHQVEVIDPVDVFCVGHSCLIARNGYNLYIDDDHLSATGASLLADVLSPIVETF